MKCKTEQKLRVKGSNACANKTGDRVDLRSKLRPNCTMDNMDNMDNMDSQPDPSTPANLLTAGHTIVDTIQALDPEIVPKFMETKEEVATDRSISLNHSQSMQFNIILDIFRITPYAPQQVKQEDCSKFIIGSVRRPTKVVFLDDLSNMDVETLMTQLDELLFERLMLGHEQLKGNLVEVPALLGSHQIEDKPSELRQLFYLYQCYFRLQEVVHTIPNEIVAVIQESIANQASSYLIQTRIYPSGSDGSTGLVIALIDSYCHEYGHFEALQTFLESVATSVQAKSGADGDDADLLDIMENGYYNELNKRFDNASLISPELFNDLSVVRLLASTRTLSKVFIVLNSPWKRFKPTHGSLKYDFNKGSGLSMSDDLMKTILGRILSVSCLPKAGQSNPEFFATPSRYANNEHEITERNIGVQLKSLVESVHQLFLSLLKLKDTKNDLLNWVGLALHAFKDRSKMWTNEMVMSTGSSVQASDGFMLNFSNVLLQLCKPFSQPYSPKLLKVDPRYCRAMALPLDKEIGHDLVGIHMRHLSEETFITLAKEDEANSSSSNSNSSNSSSHLPTQFNFMTEIFFATHKSLQIGFRSCHERFLRLASDMNHIQRVYEEAHTQSNMQGNEMLERLQEQSDKGMSQFLALKAMLSPTDSIELMLQFHVATATWLNNLAISKDADEAGLGFKKVGKANLGEHSAEGKDLRAVPEFVMENISDMVTFVRRFSDKTLASPTINLEPLMTLILVFMGSSERVRNPHSRARLAEVLESLMPRAESDRPATQYNYSMSFDVAGKLFVQHPLIEELTPTLLQVFVSIELTGQSVAFEQKFQYRRPMYMVLKYLWTNVHEPHRRRIRELAESAEQTIEAANAPLFLRFINLLMNDAIFLLDEGLNYMSQLKELQQKRDAGDWNQQQQSNYHHVGRLARFHNVIGKDTIDCLAWITEDIKRIFCHDQLVDRIAGMLNYFLKYLVGAKKSDYKVKDMNDFDFKPAHIVRDICKIYTHLAIRTNPRSDAFCSAVADDARSYSAELLPAAARVLFKTQTTENELYVNIEKLAVKIHRVGKENAEMEINVDDVPDEYLDPIMNSVMTDPVTLPSGYTMDRNTIARHLLSDQSDPFTRSPLNMDMLTQNTELKAKIDAFIGEYKRKRAEANANVNATSIDG